jgi:predicted small secreted protein
MTKKALAALAIAALCLAGCNTVRGMGKDLESVADAGERAL